ncbi:MAG TPA: hypothetical protein VFS62_16310 [Chloroflexota bacterium]|nr:hypothetical protein [Chloroflexota bacterium]
MLAIVDLHEMLAGMEAGRAQQDWPAQPLVGQPLGGVFGLEPGTLAQDRPGRDHTGQTTQPPRVVRATGKGHPARVVDDRRRAVAQQVCGRGQRELAAVGLADGVQDEVVLGQRQVRFNEVHSQHELPENTTVKPVVRRDVPPDRRLQDEYPDGFALTSIRI